MVASPQLPPLFWRGKKEKGEWKQTALLPPPPPLATIMGSTGGGLSFATWGGQRSILDIPVYVQCVKQHAFQNQILEKVWMAGNACKDFVYLFVAPCIVFSEGGAFYSREERDSCRNLLLEHLRFPHLCICVQTKRGERVILYNRT